MDSLDSLDSFGEWLRQRREAHGLTRPELADCAGCSVSALRKIEADERRPSRQLAELLASCLRILPEEKNAFLDAARGVRRVARLGPPAPPRPHLPPPPVLTFNVRPAGPAWNLPSPATPLIGREAELATLARLLENPDCRLLTLVGPGGIGKTRLAIEAACNAWEQFTSGVYFASLADIDSPEFLLSAIAKAVGLNFTGPAGPRTQLVNYLRDKQALLLLDNLEHLLEGVGELQALLAGALKLKLLVTSRERLELSSEWVLEVAGLPVPGEGQAEELESYSSAALFIQRTRQASVDFELTVQDRLHVARICRLVEGMPLAIELAAAWMKLITAGEIADEIERGLDVMTSSARDVPERQRSLRAAFQHSWNLLADEERRAFRQLSVFRGGFQREAAKTVAGADLTLLSALAAKSFLRRSAAGRFSVHALIRQYAAEQLQENPEEALAARSRHCQYYADLLVHFEPLFKSEQRQAALKEIMPELDNVRAAWQWATDNEKLGELRRMSPFLFYFFETCGLFQEGESVFRRAVNKIRGQARFEDEPEQVDAIGYLIGTLGWFNFRLGRLPQALEYLHESWDCISQFKDLESHFYAHTWLGYITWAMGDAAEARRALSEALRIAQQTGSPWHAAAPRVLLGTVAHAQGEYQEAYRLLNEALGYWRDTGDPRGLAFALASLGATNFALGKIDEAAGMLRDSIALNEEIDDRWGQTYGLNLLARVLCAQKQCAEALHLLQKSLLLSKEIGDSLGEAQTWVALGDTLCVLGEEVEAFQAYQSAWAMALEGQMTAVLISAGIGAAETCRRQGQLESALEFLLHILPHPAPSEEIKARMSQLYADITAQLRPEEIEAVKTKVASASKPDAGKA